MKRMTLLGGLLLLALTGAFVGCSNPLELPTTSEPLNPITNVIHDTVFFSDTVIITLPGDGPSQWICGRLNWARKKIVWLAQNEPGRYRLEFSAAPEKKDDKPSLIVDIDGIPYTWDLAQELDWTVGQDMGEDATIRIFRGMRSCYGHAVDICLTLTAI